MEEGLIGQLGIDFKLFLSQAINFFILLIILRAFVYKPILAVIKERNRKIKEGLEKAEEASVRLQEVDIIAKDRLKKADLESISMIKHTEEKAKLLEQDLQKKAENKQAELMKQAQLMYERQQEETKKLVAREALNLIKKFIIKTVQLKPEAVDDALINKAVSQLSKEDEPR